MTTDQLYYAIGFILTGGAIVAVVATWIIERRDKRKAALRGG